MAIVHQLRACFLIPLAIACLAASSCGLFEEPPAAALPKARAVQTWPISQDLAQRKQVIVDTCRKAGASDERTALVLAVFMQETQTGCCSERDSSKDNSGEAKNWSAFNVNTSFLKAVGWQEGCGGDLNSNDQLGEATTWVLRGMAQLGEDNFLNFHRGGSTGMADGVSYGCVDYRRQMRETQAFLLSRRDLWTDATRAGADVPHV